MQRARDQATTAEITTLIDKMAKLGYYHSIELPSGEVIPGIISVDTLRERIARYPIPQDLRGKRVLDIGAWDGWFSFEMERRGATVVAVDSARQEKFFEAKKLLNSKVEYVVEDVCHLSPRDIGYFDIVLFFGVLYHLKHPLLALERVCELCTDMACIETLVLDDPPQPGAIPVMEFYETTELAGQFDNWCAPNTACLMGFMRTAGFVNSKLLGVYDGRAHAVGYRKWARVNDSLTERASPSALEVQDAPELVCVENIWTRDHTFSSNRDHYFSAWFSTARTDLDCDNVFVEVGPYASRPVGVTHLGGVGWQANCKLPPGVSRGWFDVRLALGEGPWSNPARIAVDLSLEERRAMERASDAIEILGVTDGKNYEENRVYSGVQSSVSVWAKGLPENAAKADVTLRLDGTDLPAVYLSAPDAVGTRQINAMLPPQMQPREYQLTVCAQGAESRPRMIEIAISK